MEHLKTLVLPLQSCYKENKGDGETAPLRYGSNPKTKELITIYKNQKNINTRYGKEKFIPKIIISTNIFTDHDGWLIIDIINNDDRGLVKKYVLKMENNGLTISDLRKIYEELLNKIDVNSNTGLVDFITYMMDEVMTKYEIEVIG